MYFALGSHVLCSVVIVKWQNDDPFAGPVFGVDVPSQKSSVLTGGLCAAILLETALQQDVEIFPVGRNGQSFETLVVLATRDWVRGDGGLGWVEDRRGIGGEGFGAISHGNECLRGDENIFQDAV